ncbi:uncharacterized protein SCHCODRAFT_02498402 [Schizophyllum commune H4-8]|uniref:Uncharacterized protein n=1 Tax=Schizophyllum commune (strain H4-8 / FGSC 9210) TaxID=578458 RepID=D8PS32_SCHCM|nr:uncharacterized protein SCHCODRAFT_02498402 [Schizophyllum commune H4-8]KAI5893929.1 hypothetical protein SCHCODRAFT_02498402 [Schizophyllum commune H4-8]
MQEYEDPKLRNHVRSLLLDYCLQHLATDYIEYTESLFDQLISGFLTQIPEHDTSSLRLPVDVDPLEKFLAKHAIESLSFDEKLQIDQHIVEYIKKYTKVLPRNRAEQAAYDDQHECLSPPYRPPTPAMSRKARSETPHLGKLGKGPASTYDAVQSAHSLQPVDVQPIPEPDLDLSACLDVKFQLPAHELAPVRNLIKSSQFNSAEHCNSWLDPRRPPSPPAVRSRSPSPFMPLFARLQRPGNGQPPPPAPKAPQTTADLAQASLPTLPAGEDQQSHITNMVVVDGWSALQSSPSPLTTPSASQEDDHLDELFQTSTPPTEPLSLFETMDTVIFPRKERLDGRATSQKPLGSDKALSAFLMPLISAQHDGSTKADERPQTPDSAPASSPPSLSLVGAPPSPVGREDRLRRLLGDEELSLDVGQIYREVKEHPADLIMKDRPDDKADLLMEVPELSPPNEHAPGGLIIPEKFAQLLPPPKSDSKAKEVHQFLRRAKGLPSLNTSLSWMLFKSDAMLPTRDEACGAATLFDHQDFDGTSLETMNEQVQTLFAKACIINEDEKAKDQWDDKNCRFAIQDSIEEDLWRGDLLLTREERWRRSGYVPPVDDTVRETLLEGAAEQEPERIAKRARTDAPTYTAQAPTDTVTTIIDDSGIVLLDDLPASKAVERPRDDAALQNSITAQPAHADIPFADYMRSNHALLAPVTSAFEARAPTLSPSASTYANEHPYDHEPIFDQPFNGQQLPYGEPEYDQQVPYEYCDDNKENIPQLAQDAYTEISSLDYADYDMPAARSPSFFSSAIDDGNADMDDLSMLSSNALQLTFEPPQAYPSRTQSEVEVESQLSLITPEPDYVGGSQFIPLSFDSLQPATSRRSQSRVRDDPSSFGDTTTAREDIFDSSSKPSARFTRATLHADNFDIAAAADLANHSLGIFDFALLRAKKVTAPAPPPPPIISRPATPEEPRKPPETIYDANTLRLPSTWTIPGTVHRYLASIDCVQKQALMRGLRSEECAVDVVERDSLGGVDFIIDAHTGVMLVSLLSLPGDCADAVARIATQTWNFDRLLVVLEAYPSTYAKKIERRSAAPFAYTPPVLKALQKLRRDLNIEQACGTSREATELKIAFADTVSEAALFVRMFGNEAEEMDTTDGALWGGREWLDDEPYEGEMDFAAVKGMNVFAAIIMLCQEDLTMQDVLNMSPKQRLVFFGPFIGVDRVESFNSVLSNRRQQGEAMSLVDASSELLAPGN